MNRQTKIPSVIADTERNWHRLPLAKSETVPRVFNASSQKRSASWPANRGSGKLRSMSHGNMTPERNRSTKKGEDTRKRTKYRSRSPSEGTTKPKSKRVSRSAQVGGRRGVVVFDFYSTPHLAVQMLNSMGNRVTVMSGNMQKGRLNCGYIAVYLANHFHQQQTTDLEFTKNDVTRAASDEVIAEYNAKLGIPGKRAVELEDHHLLELVQKLNTREEPNWNTAPITGYDWFEYPTSLDHVLLKIEEDRAQRRNESMWKFYIANTLLSYDRDTSEGVHWILIAVLLE